jgi:VanZ family protein
MLDVTGSKNDLWMPKYLVFNKSFLGLPDGQSFLLSDLIVNLLGFVPLGFLIGLWLTQVGRPRSWACLVLAAAVGCTVSLTIEVTQVWLPGRDSSLLDLIANTAGTAIGGAMGSLQYIRRRLANAAGMTKF